MAIVGRVVGSPPVPGTTPEAVKPAPAADAKSAGKAQGKALVPIRAVEAAANDLRSAGRRASATFLAQLIANDKQLPQTRERRRADPHEALAAYGAVARMTAGPAAP